MLNAFKLLNISKIQLKNTKQQKNIKIVLLLLLLLYLSKS